MVEIHETRVRVFSSTSPSEAWKQANEFINSLLVAEGYFLQTREYKDAWIGPIFGAKNIGRV